MYPSVSSVLCAYDSAMFLVQCCVYILCGLCCLCCVLGLFSVLCGLCVVLCIVFCVVCACYSVDHSVCNVVA